MRVAAVQLLHHGQQLDEPHDLRRLGRNHHRASIVVPQTDDPARLQHTAHLRERPHRLPDVLEHRVGEHRVEGGVSERQCAARPPSESGRWRSLAPTAALLRDLDRGTYRGLRQPPLRERVASASPSVMEPGPHPQSRSVIPGLTCGRKNPASRAIPRLWRYLMVSASSIGIDGCPGHPSWAALPRRSCGGRNLASHLSLWERSTRLRGG